MASQKALFDQAKAARGRGDLPLAIGLYRKLVDAYPNDRIAWHNLASALGDFGAHEPALEAV